MLVNTSKWSHARGNEVVPSRWQATRGCMSILTIVAACGVRPFGVVLMSSNKYRMSSPFCRWMAGTIDRRSYFGATLARAIRVHTSYARANREAHTLIRQALTGSGDIYPHDGVLTVRLDPLPTRRATKAITELCEHLTATKTRYPGTDLILRYEIKTRP